MMLKKFYQIFFEVRLKVYICFLVVCFIPSCAKDYSYEDRQYNNSGYPNRTYNYSHYPNSTYRPNSRYYSGPYEISPQQYYYDYDQYYTQPYGYGYSYGDNSSPADDKI